LITKYMIIVHI